jgi:DNA-binding NarL/FixJ family response regulator
LEAIRAGAERVREILTTCLEEQAPAVERKRPKRRRRKTDAVPRPLTAKQAEAIQIVGECKGNFAQAADRIGRDRATVRQHYNAGMKKLGRTAVKHRTQQLPSDKRGQDSVSSDDDRRG